MSVKEIQVGDQKFTCPGFWNVDEAENKIRRWYLLAGGGLLENGVPLLGNVLISSTTGALSFSGGQAQHAVTPTSAPPESSLAAEMKTMRKAMDRQERNSSGFVEDRVRDSAANMFGVATMRRFLAKCLYDLVVLSNPHEYSHEDIVAGESQLEQFAREHFVAFVQAFYEHLCSKVDDPSRILVDNPWVVSGVVAMENIKSCGGVLNNSQNAIKKRILYALETNDAIMSPFRRSAGPGLSIIVWKATCMSAGLGEFLCEIEVDCRGKVDLLLTTHRAVVLGAEIKTSAEDIPRAKKQLIRRFKIIATCLAATHKIKPEESIYVGRVFYRNVPENSIIDSSEDASGNDLATLSFYYHRV